MENLEKLINCRSDSSCIEITKLVKKEFSSISSEILMIETKNPFKPFLLIGLNGLIENSEPIILSGHIDTVCADETNYATNPYKLTINGNKAYGLGVIDMKCFFASILDIAKDFSKDIPHLALYNNR